MITRTIVKATVEYARMVKTHCGAELQSEVVDLFFTHEPSEEEIKKQANVILLLQISK